MEFFSSLFGSSQKPAATNAEVCLNTADNKSTAHSKFGSYLKNCKIQLPIPHVNKNGVKNGSVMEIKPSEIMRYKSEFFYGDPIEECLIFNCPDHGATTGGTKNPRVELRDMREWTLQGNVVHTLRGSFKVLQAPSSGQIVCSQIHGCVRGLNGTECLIMIWDNGKIIVRTKHTVGSNPVRTLVVPGILIGDMIEYFISISNYQLSVTVNGKVGTADFDKSWDGVNVCFKAGTYLNDHSNSGTFGKIAYYILSDI